MGLKFPLYEKKQYAMVEVLKSVWTAVFQALFDHTSIADVPALQSHLSEEIGYAEKTL